MQTFQLAVAPNIEMNFIMNRVITNADSRGNLTLPLNSNEECTLIEPGQIGIVHFADNRQEKVKVMGLEKNNGQLNIQCRIIRSKGEGL